MRQLWCSRRRSWWFRAWPRGRPQRGPLCKASHVPLRMTASAAQHVWAKLAASGAASSHSPVRFQPGPRLLFNTSGKCTACGDANTVDADGNSRPGMCQSCATGFILLTGQQPTNYRVDYRYGYLKGKCLADNFCDGATQYVEGDIDGVFCWSLLNSGSSCFISDPFKCTSGVCKGPSGDSSGYCCDGDATEPIAGECCTLLILGWILPRA